VNGRAIHPLVAAKAVLQCSDLLVARSLCTILSSALSFNRTRHRLAHLCQGIPSYGESCMPHHHLERSLLFFKPPPTNQFRVITKEAARKPCFVCCSFFVLFFSFGKGPPRVRDLFCRTCKRHVQADYKTSQRSVVTYPSAT